MHLPPAPKGPLPLISQQRGRRPGCGSRFPCERVLLGPHIPAQSLKKPLSRSVRETPPTQASAHSHIPSRGVPGNPHVLGPTGASPPKQGWLPMPREIAWCHGWEHWGRAGLGSHPGSTHNPSKSLSSSDPVFCTVARIPHAPNRPYGE